MIARLHGSFNTTGQAIVAALADAIGTGKMPPSDHVGPASCLGRSWCAGRVGAGLEGEPRFADDLAFQHVAEDVL
jgi:hypothetical protein